MAALGALLLIGAVLLLLVLCSGALALAVRGHRREAVRAAASAGILVVVYAAALVGVAVASPGGELATGEWKCFDEWCASVASVSWAGDTVDVALDVQNRGRRSQAPDTARVWWLHDGRREEVVVPGLGSQVPGGSTRRLPHVRLTAATGGSVPAPGHRGWLPQRAGAR